MSVAVRACALIDSAFVASRTWASCRIGTRLSCQNACAVQPERARPVSKRVCSVYYTSYETLKPSREPPISLLSPPSISPEGSVRSSYSRRQRSLRGPCGTGRQTRRFRRFVTIPTVMDISSAPSTPLRGPVGVCGCALERVGLRVEIPWK